MALPEKIFSFLVGNLSANLIRIKCLRGISAQLHENIDDEIPSNPTGQWLFTIK
jgi:hypothetical protein